MTDFCSRLATILILKQLMVKLLLLVLACSIQKTRLWQLRWNQSHIKVPSYRYLLGKNYQYTVVACSTYMLPIMAHNSEGALITQVNNRFVFRPYRRFTNISVNGHGYNSQRYYYAPVAVHVYTTAVVPGICVSAPGITNAPETWHWRSIPGRHHIHHHQHDHVCMRKLRRIPHKMSAWTKKRERGHSSAGSLLLYALVLLLLSIIGDE